MRIEKLDIKGFGKFNNFEVEFKKGFNIVFGANESGKSTIEAFIKAMFYSLKRGRNFKGESNPLKRYKPWIGNDYKGIMKYVLDNNQVFTVERNFEKGETRVYDLLYKDITKTFDQSKDKGPLFALRHIGLTEACFDKTLYIGQMGTKLDTSDSKDILDRLSNISETGFEEISFKGACDAIKEAMKSYVGTDKTSTRPLDIINSKLDELNFKRQHLLEVKESLFYVDEEINFFNDKRNKLENVKTVMQFAKDILKTREDIDVYKRNRKDLTEIILEISDLNKDCNKLYDSISEYRKIKIQRLKDSTDETIVSKLGKLNIKKSVLIKFIMFICIALFALLFYGFISKNYVCVIGAVILFVIFLVITILNSRNSELYKRIYNLEAELEKNCSMISETVPYLSSGEDRLKDINKRIENLYNKAYLICGQKINNKEAEKEVLYEIEKKLEKLYENLDIYAHKIKTLYLDAEFEDITYERLMEILLDLRIEETKSHIEEFIQKIFDSLNETQVILKEKEMTFKGLSEDNNELEKLEEDIRELEIRKEKLEEVGFSLKTALEVLDEANTEIKRDFAPVLNSNASKIVNSITSCKYEELKVDENLVLRTIDPSLKEIIPIYLLSSGTADQMYLALRIALVQTIEKKTEKLPLIMDEILSQYDDIRSIATIRMLKEMSNERQIIFFTCKSREIELVKFVCNNNINIIEL